MNYTNTNQKRYVVITFVAGDFFLSSKFFFKVIAVSENQLIKYLK